MAATDTSISSTSWMRMATSLASTRPAAEFGNWATRDYFNALRSARSNDPFIGRPYQITQEDKVGADGQPPNDGPRRATSPVSSSSGCGWHTSATCSADSSWARTTRWHLLRDDGVILMRLPFDRERYRPHARHRGTVPRLHAHRRLRRFRCMIPIDQVERRFAFRRVGSLPLVVSVGVAIRPIWAGIELVAAGAGSRPMPADRAAGPVAAAANRAGVARPNAKARRSHASSRRSSHELRTPLHGVLGYADQLVARGRPGPAQSRQAVAEIVRAGKHMRDVVNRRARLRADRGARAGARTCGRSTFGIWSRNAWPIVEPGARARGLETRNDGCRPTLPAQFVTDDMQLRQILMNLLSNAVKYTPQRHDRAAAERRRRSTS